MTRPEDPLAALMSHTAIQRLHTAYADCVNRRAFGALSELFLADALIELTPLRPPRIELRGPEALGDFIARAVERFDFFQFVVLNAHFAPGPDDRSADGRVFMCEYRREHASSNWTQVFGVYHDRYREVEGRWWFARRTFHPLASQGSDDVVFPVPPELSARFQGPP
ncbi:MAG: nuclear transport factor 2 family protein [Myxococcota bacterium]